MDAIEHIFDEIGGFHWFQVVMIVWVYSNKFMVSFVTTEIQNYLLGREGDFR